MKVKTFTDNDEWLEYRRTRITGKRANDIKPSARGGGMKKGYYELIAEHLGAADEGENPMERGHRLEIEAIDRFAAATGKEVDPTLVIWMRDDEEHIAVSPDGSIDGGKEAVEAKCLNSASHVEAYLTGEIPKEYESQALQYFVVNDNLEKLYFCFYDPRLRHIDFFYRTITREEMLPQIEASLVLQRQTLTEVREIVAKLSQF